MDMHMRDLQGKTTEEQIEIIEKTQAIFKKLIGHEVTGFRTPSGDWAKITPAASV